MSERSSGSQADRTRRARTIGWRGGRGSADGGRPAAFARPEFQPKDYASTQRCVFFFSSFGREEALATSGRGQGKGLCAPNRRSNSDAPTLTLLSRFPPRSHPP